jgi:predicted transposase YbfD/YdcC
LLRVLELKGALVTIDAAGCQVEIAEQIRARRGDYLLAVKGNQPALQAAVQALFDRACAVDFAGVRYDMHATTESGPGREEERYVTVIYQPEGLPAEWPDVAAVVQVGRERKVSGKKVSTAHYYLTSRRAKAQRLGEAIRGPWKIENGRHWVLDVAFGEDDNSTRAGHAGANLGLVRRLALSLLKQDPAKGSIKAKRRSAALDDNYLLRILQGISEN